MTSKDFLDKCQLIVSYNSENNLFQKLSSHTNSDHSETPNLKHPTLSLFENL